MTEGINATGFATPTASLGAGGGTAPSVSFRDVLSALNPLQYLPVVGSIYRAVTGDSVGEPMRIGGSMVASLLMGGPIGLLMSAASTAFQKLTGVDPDAMSHDVLAAIGVIGPTPAKAPPALVEAQPDGAMQDPVVGWTTARMAAYGGSAPAVAAMALLPAAAADRTTALLAYARMQHTSNG
jgi:hypothetical protein